jgi:polyhydroxyalkanoate synthesis regulator phasin
MGLVFVSGAVLGVFGDRYYTSVSTIERGKGKGKGKRRMSPEEFRRGYMDYMERRLKLTPDQVAKLGLFLDETQQAMDDLMRRTVPEQQALRQQQTEKIRGMLTVEQKAEYEKMLREREEFNRKNKWEDKRPGGPGSR